MIMLVFAALSHSNFVPKRVMLWDGKTTQLASTWVNPSSSVFTPSPNPLDSGERPLELRFNDSHVWIGFGYDWFNWKTGLKEGTDTRGMTRLTFRMKATGLQDDLQLQLLCNGKVVDTPAHHTVKVSVAKYCSSIADGHWHEVVIPLKDLKYSKGYHPQAVTMIDFGFYAQNPTHGTILLNDLSFDNTPVDKAPL